VEFNHVPFSTAEQKVIWGAGYRTSRSEADPTRLVLFDPVVKQLRWANLFVQDELRVTDRTRVTLGGKFETNVYTGLEFLPTLRATYQLRDSGLVWGSLSRAVRAPARLDREFYFPAAAPFQIKGGPDFQSEVANVAEIGYRSQATERFSYSLTAFHHEYRRLRGGTVAPTFIENRVAGSVAGLEAWGNAKVTDHWRLSAGLIELRKSLRAAPGSSSTSATDLGNDPRHQWTVRSTLDLGSAVELDLAVRHVSSLPAPAVGSYTATDVRLAWQISPALSLTLIVQNLLDPGHIEFNAPAAASQIPRSAFVGLEWRTL